MPERVRFQRNPFLAPRLPGDLLPPPAGARAFHRTLPGYAPTPLVELPALAKELGVGRLFLKDESKRFGLNAFKGLGASYAIHRVMKANPSRSWTFATATDGNHGRAVAWSAKRLGQKAVIFVPKNTVKARIDAIRGEGAEVIVVDGTYDDTVKRAADEATKHGWQVISDTAWPGYMEIPGWIMAGYETLFEEAEEQRLKARAPHFDALFLQAGVGGLAYAGVAHANRGSGMRPSIVCVEPTDADCLLESIASKDGSIRVAKGKQDSIMAGLNCGTPSLLAWPALRAGIDFFLAVDDDYAREAMRRLARPKPGDPVVVSGESGAAGLAGLLALANEASLAGERAALPLGKENSVLLISTEGDTDPVNYAKIVDRDLT